MTDDVAVLDALRDAILDGEFAAGQRLVEVDLCERFGCSRFAVRAAIPVLASEGLVELQRHRGARVRVIPVEEAIEITEVRRLLEGLTAARAAERVTPPQAAELAEIIQEMRDAVAAAELLRYSDANARLHSLDPGHRRARHRHRHHRAAARPAGPAPVRAVPGARPPRGVARPARAHRGRHHRARPGRGRGGHAGPHHQRHRGTEESATRSSQPDVGGNGRRRACRRRQEVSMP